MKSCLRNRGVEISHVNCVGCYHLLCDKYENFQVIRETETNQTELLKFSITRI